MINNQDTAWLKPALPDYIFTRFQKQKMSIVCWDRLNYFCSTASVDANLTLLKPAHRTDMLIELWHYHNEDDQSWVQQSLAGANVVPDAMAPDNMIYTLDLVFQSHDSDF
jgi:hypothetical protein